MKALSMISKEWVLEPITIDSIRIHAISYMKDASPVQKEATRKMYGQPRPIGFLSVSNGFWGFFLARKYVVIAMAIFSNPAENIEPGKPTELIKKNVITSSAMAAPILFAKYNIEIDLPGLSVFKRTNPLHIKGKVVPNKIDCGRISTAATSIL
jgi:hypothetical protein